MRRLLYFVVALLFVATGIQAQKIDARLTTLLSSIDGSKAKSAVRGQYQETDTAAVKQDINVSFNSDGTVKSFSTFAMVKEDYNCPTAELQELGVEIREKIGRMLILTIPAESLLKVGDIEAIEYVNADKINRIMNENGRLKSRVSEVATEEMAVTKNHLPQAYTGKNVLVGIIDTGIDFNHAAFRNADGSTRIKMALRKSGNELLEFTTDSQIAPLISDLFDESHGSHVAGTAAGSIVEGTNKQGMAPEADLLLCGLGGSLAESNIVQAIKKMFDYSKAEGKPCVINLSMGYVDNFHDGTVSDVVTGLKEYYKEDVQNKVGRIVVFSSGNTGGYHAALYEVLPAAGADGYNLRTVPGVTFQDSYNNDKLGQVIVSYYDKIRNFFYMMDGSDFDVDVKVVNVKTGETYSLSEKPLYSILFDEPLTSLTKSKGIDRHNNKHYVEYSMDGSSIYLFHEPDLKLAYFVKGPAGKTLRAMDYREGKEFGFHSEDLAGYTEGQDNGAFNIHTCADEVISVGAYVSEYKWKSIDGKEQWSTSLPKENDIILPYSSWGVDDNGVSRPDVVAPGAAICSAYNFYDASYFDGNGNVKAGTEKDITDKVTLSSPFDHPQYYGSMDGTSMAAPNATGVIALWLQAKPDMTYADVRALIKETCYNDEYTTNPELIPSRDVRQAGAGKIDALAGLQKLTGTTAINMVGEGSPRHATPATMYDVDDNCYNTLGQRVSKNAKGLIIYKGKVYLNR